MYIYIRIYIYIYLYIGTIYQQRILRAVPSAEFCDTSLRKLYNENDYKEISVQRPQDILQENRYVVMHTCVCKYVYVYVYIMKMIIYVGAYTDNIDHCHQFICINMS
jgi:hypothetical protein